MERSWLLRGGRVVQEASVMEAGAVVVLAGRIAWVGPEAELPRQVATTAGAGPIAVDQLPVLDARGGIISPGLIDLHVHGGGGADTLDGTVDALRVMAEAHARHGTTVFLPTTMTERPEPLARAAAAVQQAVAASGDAEWAGARVLGLHLEGPYVNPKMAGAQNPAYVRSVDRSELEALLATLGEHFRLITMAPEVAGAPDAIEWLAAQGVVVSLGHTAATYEEAVQAVAWGARHATHTYNAMSGLHHRNPGMLGAVLTEPRLVGELIADGIHVHPAAMRLAVQAKGADGICLVTDAISAMGMPEGNYTLGGLDVVVSGGACRLASGALAGSVLSMDRAVAQMVERVGVPLCDAVRMASLTPAREIGVDGERGSLRRGKLADIAVLTSDLHCRATLVEGRLVHRAESERE